MAAITPPDPSYRLQAYLTCLLATSLACFLRTPNLLQMILTLVLPTLAFTLLAHRYITFERTCALRLALTQLQFHNQLAHRGVMEPSDVDSCRNFLVPVLVLANLMIIARQSGSIALDSWIQATFWSGVEWLLQIALVLFSLVVIAMSCSSAEYQFVFKGGKDAVGDDQVPLIASGVISAKAGEWCEVSLVNNGQLIYVRQMQTQTEEQDEEDGRKSFELKTALWQRHPDYSPEQDGQATGAILRIIL